MTASRDDYRGFGLRHFIESLQSNILELACGYRLHKANIPAGYCRDVCQLDTTIAGRAAGAFPTVVLACSTSTFSRKRPSGVTSHPRILPATVNTDFGFPTSKDAPVVTVAAITVLLEAM